jgi:hypothetical protein
MELPGEFDHPAWVTAIGTVIGWGLVLAVVTLVLFVLPYLLWP